MNAITIGLDLAKTVFHVHGEDAAGQQVVSKRLSRGQLVRFFRQQPRCLVGMEACGSAHYWGRVLRGLGHDVRLIPASYVAPYVQRNKTDARDAAAICEAVRRPRMRFVTIKTEAQQAARALERTRALMIKQRTQMMNSLRAQMAEFGIIAPLGRKGLAALVTQLAAAADRMARQAASGGAVEEVRARPAADPDAAPVPETLPEPLVVALQGAWQLIETLDRQIEVIDARIVATVRADPVMRQLAGIPCIGPLTAHAVVAAVGDGKQFKSGRDLAAWLGLTPRVQSSGGKERQGGISRQGDRSLRTLFALGAVSHLSHLRRDPSRASAWLASLLDRRPFKVAVIALAAKNARIAWAVMTKGQPYRAPVRPAAPAQPAQPPAPAAETMSAARRPADARLLTVAPSGRRAPSVPKKKSAA